MDLDLRKAVIHNVKEDTQDQLKDTIVDAIQRGEEKMLPGLGVLFEVIWNHADTQEQKNDAGNARAGAEPGVTRERKEPLLLYVHRLFQSVYSCNE